MDSQTLIPRTVELGPGVSARVVAAARVSFANTDIAALRPTLQAFFKTISVAILKQVDELTMISLEALRQAILKFGITAEHQVGWGVVANPSRLGRSRMFDAIVKFREQGAWSVTPHFIPHSLLHSMSGLLSQALGITGPNMGVGGVPDSQEDLCVSMASWIAGRDTTGGWLIWAEWLNPELAEAQVFAVEQCECEDPSLGARAQTEFSEHERQAKDVFAHPIGWKALQQVFNGVNQ